MKEKLSFRHMLQLVRYYWRTEKHLYLRLYLGLVGIYLFLSLFSWILCRFFSPSQMSGIFMIFNFEWVFWGFILISMAHMFSSLETKQRATTLLTLPANNLEKFVTRVVYVTLGIWLLAFAARITANFIGATLLIFDTLFMNGEWTLSQIFYYRILPSTWSVFYVNYGSTFILGFLKYVLWVSLLALWPWSLFTLFGILFRRHGWLWAIPVLFVGVFAAYLIFDVVFDGTFTREHEGLVRSLFAAFILLPSAFNYWLGYHCFRRAQVITDKPTRL
ncbi:MAG: hypothetical protein IKH91_01260 [Prevotella sp.]|nr:hypothetical protein [Prevotella sp.]